MCLSMAQNHRLRVILKTEGMRWPDEKIPPTSRAIQIAEVIIIMIMIMIMIMIIIIIITLLVHPIKMGLPIPITIINNYSP